MFLYVETALFCYLFILYVISVDWCCSLNDIYVHFHTKILYTHLSLYLIVVIYFGLKFIVISNSSINNLLIVIKLSFKAF